MSYGGSGGGGSQIATSADVALNSPTNGQMLSYNTSLAKWQNAAVVDANAVPSSVVGQANGVAALNTSGVIPLAQLPVSAASVLRATSGVPSSLASDQSGDFAYDAAAKIIYGPFSGVGASGTWPAGTLLGNQVVRGGVPTTGAYLVTANDGTTATVALATAGLTYMVPVTVLQTQTFTGLSTYLVTQAVGATSPLVVMGIYSDSGTGRPTGSVLTGSTVSFDPTAQAAGVNANAAFSSPLTLAAGSYYLALSITFTGSFSTTPVATSLVPIGNTWLAATTTSLGNVSSRGWTMSGATGTTLPSATSAVQGSGSFPIIALKAQ